jgi:hypothetical protein
METLNTIVAFVAAVALGLIALDAVRRSKKRLDD